ncbi:hypothetical protein ACOME3_001432 [Neoechinorhynchus agilis]
MDDNLFARIASSFNTAERKLRRICASLESNPRIALGDLDKLIQKISNRSSTPDDFPIVLQALRCLALLRCSKIPDYFVALDRIDEMYLNSPAVYSEDAVWIRSRQNIFHVLQVISTESNDVRCFIKLLELTYANVQTDRSPHNELWMILAFYISGYFTDHFGDDNLKSAHFAMAKRLCERSDRRKSELFKLIGFLCSPNINNAHDEVISNNVSSRQLIDETLLKSSCLTIKECLKLEVPLKVDTLNKIDVASQCLSLPKNSDSSFKKDVLTCALMTISELERSIEPLKRVLISTTDRLSLTKRSEVKYWPVPLDLIENSIWR